MSELSRLLGKSEEVTVGGLTFMIKPLTVGDLELVGDMDPDHPDAGVMKKIIQKTLRESFPDSTDKEIDGVALEHMDELTKAIAKVNKFKVDDAKSKLIERVKSGR